MKIIRTRLQQISFLLFIASINTVLLAQTSNDKLTADSIYNEEILITTDRDIYISGEQVWMKVYKINRINRTPSDLSKIVYVELLDESNNPVVQIKSLVDGASGSCRFRLPDTLSSNNYLIRAYTRWMINYPVDLFCYKTISVINPFNGIDRIIPPSSATMNNSSMSLPQEGIHSYGAYGKIPGKRLNLKVSLNKDQFMNRENVRLGISVRDASGNPVNADLSVSAVKSFLTDTVRNDFFIQENKEEIMDSAAYSGVQIPEHEGEIISGVIRNKTTNEPLIGTDISLSFVGKVSRCQFEKTNENGRFIFIAPGIYGLNEMVIQPLIHDISGSYAELDLPFCSTFKDYKPAAFYIDSNKVENINKAVISMQVNNVYEPSIQQKQVPHDSDAIYDFYGLPTRKILMSDFIELTDVREIIKEILPEVNVDRKNKEPILKVISTNPYQTFKEPALVLVDGVPVYNIENLMKIKASEIERIYIVDAKYFYHDYIFEGIVSFVTKKGNLSAFEFDDSVYRRVFEGCQPGISFYSPDYSDESKRASRIPDFRNTLYWNPDIKSSPAGDTMADFFTSDEAGEYTIIVKGMSSDGSSGYVSATFLVK